MRIQDRYFYTGIYSDEACLVLDYAMGKCPSPVFESHGLYRWTRRAPDGEIYLKIDASHMIFLESNPKNDLMCKSGEYDRAVCKECPHKAGCMLDLAVEEIREIADRALLLMSFLEMIFHFRLFWDLFIINTFYPNGLSKRLIGKPAQDPFRFSSMEILAEEYRRIQNDEENNGNFITNARKLREIKNQYSELKYGKEHWTWA